MCHIILYAKYLTKITPEPPDAAELFVSEDNAPPPPDPVFTVPGPPALAPAVPSPPPPKPPFVSPVPPPPPPAAMCLELLFTSPKLTASKRAFVAATVKAADD
jgi:hypothetical protein